MKLRFRYTNHRGDEHEYTIEPVGISFKDCDCAGTPGEHWTITGLCLERDGESRHSNSAGFPIRSFALVGMKDIEEVR